jgi:hypothetical protein
MATCVAPGHPTCKITCKKGCIAYFLEPDGPCKTLCSGSKLEVETLSDGVRISIQAYEVDPSDFLDVFGKGASQALVDNLKASQKPLSFILQAATLDEIFAKVAQEV